MKSLATIQKIADLLRVICRIAAVFAVIGACASLVAVTIYSCMMSGRDVPSIISGLVSQIEADSYFETIAVLLCDFIGCLVTWILLRFANEYLTTELCDRTPFTERGANLMKKFGITTIVLSLASALTYVAIDMCLKTSAANHLTGGYSFTAGVALVLFSLVLRYGAELEAKKEALPQTEEAAEAE